MSALAATIRDPRVWARDVVFTAAMALTLAVLGPFGSFDLPFAERLAQNFVYGFASVAFLWQPMRLALRIGERVRAPELLVLVVGLTVLTVPVTLVCAWVSQSLNLSAGGQPFWAAYLIIVSMVLPFGVAYLLIEKRLLGRAQLAAPPHPAKLDQIHPRLFVRLPGQADNPIIALEAEDHYVRVHTGSGSMLVLMRLADAIAEMDGVDGMRVHRSWWVARRAVGETRRQGRKVILKLTNGLEVPVTREAGADLRRHGWF